MSLNVLLEAIIKERVKYVQSVLITAKFVQIQTLVTFVNGDSN